MNRISANCSKLNKSNIFNFNASKERDMVFMLYNCSELKSLDLSKFDSS